MSGLEPWFVLSYPRSRTAWLATYLTGAGAYTFHEAWKLASTPDQLRDLMSSKGPGPVVNSDCSNVFFLPELQQTFPDARYIRILNDERTVLASLKESYGDYDYTDMMDWYARAFEQAEPSLTLDCGHWTEASVRDLWAVVSGGQPFDREWYTQMNGCLVQLMPWQIQHDIERVVAGELDHINAAMQRWRASWV